MMTTRCTSICHELHSYIELCLTIQFPQWTPAKFPVEFHKLLDANSNNIKKKI